MGSLPRNEMGKARGDFGQNVEFFALFEKFSSQLGGALEPGISTRDTGGGKRSFEGFSGNPLTGWGVLAYTNTSVL